VVFLEDDLKNDIIVGIAIIILATNLVTNLDWEQKWQFIYFVSLINLKNRMNLKTF
jgi:hypothetical protein